MIGLADRAAVFDLFEKLMNGDIKSALDLFNAQYDLGAEPLVVLQDLLDLTHWLTRAKIAPELADDPSMASAERERGAEMAKKLSMPVLTRTWQMLLKGINETVYAPSAKQAAEMLLIRLAYAAELPPPAEIIGSLGSARTAPAPMTTTGTSSFSNAPKAQSDWGGIRAAVGASSAPVPESLPKTQPKLSSFADVVACAYKQNEMMLAFNLENYASIVRFEFGCIEFYPLEKAPLNLANELAEKLNEWTGKRWLVSVVNKPGGMTLAQEAKKNEENLRKKMSVHPLVSAVIKTFPGAHLESVRLQKGIEADLPETEEFSAFQEEE